VEQTGALEGLLGAGRALYNAALEYRLLCWRRHRRTIGYLDRARDLKLLRQEFSELGRPNSSACQQILQRLEKNFRPFLRGQRGRSRFKSGTRFRSLTIKLRPKLAR